MVSAFVAWLTSLLPESASNIFSDEPNSFGAFLNAVIAFLLIAAVVYFLVVLPYTKAKDRLYPAEEEGTPATSPCSRRFAICSESTGASDPCAPR